MYRIEFEPGDIGVFRSVEEIATAIKSGAITSRSRIYHQATDKWLPIEFHPHYKKALEIITGGAPAPTPATAPTRATLTRSDPRPAIRLDPESRAVAAPEEEPLAARAAPRDAARAPEPMALRHPEPVAQAEPEPVAQAEPEPVAQAEPEPEPVAEPEPEPVAERQPEPVAAWAAQPMLAPEELAAEPEPVARFIPLDPPGEAQPDAGFADPASEPRPIVRPRLRGMLSRKPRRSFVVAFGAIVVAFATQMGLSDVAIPQRLELGIRSLPFLRPSVRTATESVLPALGNRTAHAAATLRPAAPRAGREPEPQGSPSFGSSSAFTPAASAGRDAAQATSRPASFPTRPDAKDSVIALAPAPSEIVIGAPVLSLGKPAAAGRLTPAGLVLRYQAAYAAARAELETGFRTAGFANLFAPDHLASPQGVRAARLSAGTASAYVAKYHRREAEIEAAYADSFAVLSKQLDWSAQARRVWDSHGSLQEKPEVAKLSSFLFEQIDSLYGVLAAQEGAYEIKDGAITFQDAKAARAYAELRPWLDRRAHQWADTASGAPTTAARVLRAIGATKPPEGGAL